MSLLQVDLTEQEQKRFLEYINKHINFSGHDEETLKCLATGPQITIDSFIEISINFLDVYWSSLYRKCSKKVIKDNNFASIYFDQLTNKIVIEHSQDYFSKLVYGKQEYMHWATSSVKHELLHLLFGHVFEEPVQDQEMAFIRNIAMDLSINSLLPAIIKTSVIAGSGGFYEIKKGLSYKEYYLLLYNKCIEDRAFASFLNLFKPQTNHNFTNFENMSDTEKQQLKEELTKYILSGNEIPDELLHVNTDLFIGSSAPKNFYKLISALKKKSQTNLKEEGTFSIPNRVFKYFQGTRQYFEPQKIYILIDTSTSIKDHHLNWFYSYIKYINKFFEIVTVPFSAKAFVEFQKTYPIHRFNLTKRQAQGDTNFKQPLNYVKSIASRRDIIIIFTDLDDFETDPITKQDIPKNFYFVCTTQDYHKCKNTLYKKYCFCIDSGDE